MLRKEASGGDRGLQNGSRDRDDFVVPLAGDYEVDVGASSLALLAYVELVNGGATEAVMEVSSHALDQERVSGLHFDR